MNPKMTTLYFKVLETIYDYQITIGEKVYCPLGQNEIAEILGYNRMTVNATIKELIADGYLYCIQKKMYCLSDKGFQTVISAKQID